MGRTIGPAADFYRLRLTHIDVDGDLEFDWRDDVLWREGPPDAAQESDVWVLQAVSLDEDEAVTSIAAFCERDAAEEALAESRRDLDGMTRREFDAEYLSGPAPDADHEIDGLPGAPPDC